MPRKKTAKAAKTAKTKKTKKSTAKKAAARVVNEETELLSQCESLETAVNSSFFYTNDKALDTIDNAEILKTITAKFEGLSTDNTDSVIKKALIEFLQNERYVTKILKFYHITIFELFKLFHKNYASIFKGPYLKKLKKELENKSYVSIKAV